MAGDLREIRGPGHAAVGQRAQPRLLGTLGDRELDRALGALEQRRQQIGFTLAEIDERDPARRGLGFEGRIHGGSTMLLHLAYQRWFAAESRASCEVRPGWKPQARADRTMRRPVLLRNAPA